MLPFVFLLLVPILLQHIGIKGVEYQKKNKLALTLFFVFLTLLVMLRHESVGNDTRTYRESFDFFSRLDWRYVGQTAMEAGFVCFCKIIALVFDNAQIFLAIAAIVITVMIMPTYRRLCLDSSLTIVLFCIMSTFVMMFSGIRQMIAIGIGFLAYEFTREKKLIPFLIAVIVAMTFHTSAIMLFIMYPLYHARITKKWIYFVVPVMITIFVFNERIFTVLTIFMERYMRFEGQVESTGAYTMLILFGAFIAFSFLVPDEELIDDETIGLRNFLLFATAIQMFAPLHTLAMRMAYFYIIFIPLLIPKVISCRSQRWKQVAIVGRHVMVLFFLCYFFFFAYNGGALHVFPYHFFWETVL